MKLRINRKKLKKIRDVEEQYRPTPRGKKTEGKKRGRPSAFSPKQLKQLYAMLDKGTTQVECAEHFNVSQGTISYQAAKRTK